MVAGRTITRFRLFGTIAALGAGNFQHAYCDHCRIVDHLSCLLLLEGEAGVGKTEFAKALARVHGCELIRMQCNEGLDASSALYEWNYQCQPLAIKAREGSGTSVNEIEAQIFSEAHLLERPLLASIRREKSSVLLVDEVDRADEEFETFLLELLSDFEVTIPEFGTVTARSIPRVVLTSNGTRELSNALRRRCLCHYLDFPGVDREAAIIVGSSRKAATLHNEPAKDGVPRAALDAVKAPAGVDSHAITIEEIALSVEADIIAPRRTPLGQQALCVLNEDAARHSLGAMTLPPVSDGQTEQNPQAGSSPLQAAPGFLHSIAGSGVRRRRQKQHQAQGRRAPQRRRICRKPACR